MRKISPNDVKSDFSVQVSAVEIFYQAGREAFSTDRDQSTFVEHNLLAAAVIWEGFVNDLFIAYVNRDPCRFKRHMKESLKQHLSSRSKSKRIFDQFGTLNLPTHLTKAQVVELLDADGNNITFSRYRDIERKAHSWLVPETAQRFINVPASKKATIDALISLRNHIAHRSKRSLDAMNETLLTGALYQTGLQRGQNRFHNVGSYLKATPQGSLQTRFSIFISTLKSIGAAL